MTDEQKQRISELLGEIEKLLNDNLTDFGEVSIDCRRESIAVPLRVGGARFQTIRYMLSMRIEEVLQPRRS